MELEKAKETLNKSIAIGDFVTTDWVETEIAVKTVLQALDNSISKDKVKEEIEDYKERMRYYIDEGIKLDNQYYDDENRVKILQELLEDK